MSEDREPNGYFKKGNKGNPNSKGRPPKAKEEKFHAILISTVTSEEWEKVVKKALEQAIDGDYSARKWLGEFLMGNPQQYLDLTSLGEKLFETPLDNMNDAQRKDYFSKLSAALSRNEASTNLENTEQQTE